MIDIEDVIRKQIALYRAYDAREDHDQRAGRGKQGKLSLGPYLLISREKGAGGSAVAQLAGERLGWQVFDKEIVDTISQKAHVRRELIESLDERIRTTLEGALSKLLRSQDIGSHGYLASLNEVLLTLGHQGDVIIIGRAAEFVLPSQFGLRVRMVAPLERRIQRIASGERLSLEIARAKVETADRERASFVRRQFGGSVAEPLNHDLILNTAELTLDAAAEIVITALQRKLGVTGRRKEAESVPRP